MYACALIHNLHRTATLGFNLKLLLRFGRSF
jgi:hypothetical protein